MEFGYKLIAQFLYFSYTSEVVGAIWTTGIGLGSSVGELLNCMHVLLQAPPAIHFLFSYYTSINEF